MKAIDELSVGGGHPNIVTVLRHDWRGPPFSFYLIDMELCDMNLHHYIHGERLSTGLSPENAAFVNKSAPASDKTFNVWVIMSQIAHGVEFIHSRKHVHRDLKPQNSKSPLFSADRSSLFLWYESMENHRFRLHG
jgi:serine/threonine protein kinase